MVVSGRVRLGIVVALAAVALATAPARSATRYWATTSGDWSNGANWDPPGELQPTDSLYVNNGGTVSVRSASQANLLRLAYQVSPPPPSPPPPATIEQSADLTLGSASINNSTRYYLRGGQLAVTGTLKINTLSELVQSGGGFSAALVLVTGGTYRLEGGQASTPALSAGSDGIGLILQNGGLASVGQVTLGQTALSGGTYRLAGGMLSAGAISAGLGSASFEFLGGTLRADQVVMGLAQAGGVLSPGGSPAWPGWQGVTAIGGAYTQAYGTLAVDIGAEGCDRLEVAGLASLGGTIELRCLEGFTPQQGQAFTLVCAADGFTQQQPVLTFPSSEGGGAFTVSFEGTECIATYTGILDDPHPGDANGDHMVNVGDLGILAANWGQSPRDWSTGDFNGDELVNVGDLGVLAANWGWTGAPGSAPPNVPEPAGLAMLVAGAFTLIRRRRLGD
jgi:MYXO-CTERM domain-containing protein